MAIVTVNIPMRWGDLDPYGHVNNVAVFALLEEARIAAFWRQPGSGHSAPATAILDAGTHGQTWTFVASQHVEYRQAITYRAQPLRIDLWVSAIGGASLDIDYQIIDEAQVTVAARTVIVMIDPNTGKPRRITPQECTVWEQASAPPLQFRR